MEPFLIADAGYYSYCCQGRRSASADNVMAQEGTSKQEANIHRATSRAEGSMKQVFKIPAVAREETAAWRELIRRRQPALGVTITDTKGGLSQWEAVLTGAEQGG